MITIKHFSMNKLTCRILIFHFKLISHNLAQAKTEEKKDGGM